jgi:hypothetical protein
MASSFRCDPFRGEWLVCPERPNAGITRVDWCALTWPVTNCSHSAMQVKRPKAETSPVGSKPVPAHLGDNLENDSTPTIYLLKNWSCEIEIRHYGREPRLVLVGTLVNPPANIEPALVAQWRRYGASSTDRRIASTAVTFVCRHWIALAPLLPCIGDKMIEGYDFAVRQCKCDSMTGPSQPSAAQHIA